MFDFVHVESKRLKWFFLFLFISGLALAASLPVNGSYVNGCDACNAATNGNSGYRIPGVLTPRRTYTFSFSNGVEVNFFYSTPYSTYAFQQSSSLSSGGSNSSGGGVSSEDCFNCHGNW